MKIAKTSSDVQLRELSPGAVFKCQHPDDPNSLGLFMVISDYPENGSSGGVGVVDILTGQYCYMGALNYVTVVEGCFVPGYQDS